MNKQRNINYLGMLLLIVLTNSAFTLPPNISPTEIAQNIIDSSTGNRGYYHYMKVSVNPERTKIAFSPNLINAGSSSLKTDFAANLKVFDIGSDFTLSNKQEFSSSELVTSSFFGTDIVLIFDYTEDVLKLVKVGATLTQEGSNLTNFNRFAYTTEIAVKKEKNIIVVHQVGVSETYFQIVKLDGSSNPRFPASSDTWDNALFAEAIYKFYPVAEFNPTETSTELIVAGYKIIIVDITNFSDNGVDLDSSSGIKIAFDSITGFPSPTNIMGLVYNTDDTTKLLSSIMDSGNSIMFYMDNQGSTMTLLGFIDKTIHSVNGYSIQSSLHIHSTNYFLANLIETHDQWDNLKTLIDPNSKLIVLDVGTIDGEKKIDYKVVGNEIVPSGETNPFVISMEYIDPTKGIIVFTGGIDASTTYKGWYRILRLGEDYQPKICHEDCQTCNTKSITPSPLDCLSCKDTNIKIIGTSGCKCHENCLSCSENQNEKKCTFCKAGFYLDNGECIDGIAKNTELQKSNEKIKSLEEEVNNCSGGGGGGGDSNIVIAIYERKCGSILIPGCLECHENVSEGCKTCQKGAGIEDKGGVDYCVICPFRNCEECSMTDQGRQCQKCFEGLKFNQQTQSCFGSLTFLEFSVFLVLGFVFGFLQ